MRMPECIKDNLNAFISNFGDVRIEKEEYGKGYYVYYPVNADTWIQYCYNKDYLNGWLYGCVQAANRKEFKK